MAWKEEVLLARVKDCSGSILKLWGVGCQQVRVLRFSQKHMELYGFALVLCDNDFWSLKLHIFSHIVTSKQKYQMDCIEMISFRSSAIWQRSVSTEEQMRQSGNRHHLLCPTNLVFIDVFDGKNLRNGRSQLLCVTAACWRSPFPHQFEWWAREDFNQAATSGLKHVALWKC